MGGPEGLSPYVFPQFGMFPQTIVYVLYVLVLFVTVGDCVSSVVSCVRLWGAGCALAFFAYVGS